MTQKRFPSPAQLGLGVRVSMDGKDRCLDNVFVERLWRSLKHEEIYLKRYESMVDAHKQIGAYLVFYNDRRPHPEVAPNRRKRVEALKKDSTNERTEADRDEAAEV